MCTIWIGCRKSYTRVRYLNCCSRHQSHIVHVLGCKERPRLQFPRPLSLWCGYCSYIVCPDSGEQTSWVSINCLTLILEFLEC